MEKKVVEIKKNGKFCLTFDNKNHTIEAVEIYSQQQCLRTVCYTTDRRRNRLCLM